MAFLGNISGKTDAFQYLRDLLEQDQFEVISTIEKNITQKIKVVYMMNDAVESFLVFTEAYVTGEIRKDYEGRVSGELVERKEDYVLIIRQGKENVFTIYFKNLDLENHLFDYGNVGHFWMKGYEHIRQIEYRLAIMRDKCDYLGEGAFTEMEKKLSVLTEFPPLNICSYPAVSRQYAGPDKNSWRVSREALEVMKEIAIEENDKSFLKILKIYEKIHGKMAARWIAIQIRKKKHRRIIENITDQIKLAASAYEKRSFGAKKDEYYRVILDAAEKKALEIRSTGKRVDIVREEPFVYAQDGIEYHTYLLIWKNGFLNTKAEILCCTIKNS